jgi:type IV fimbrial biogenesis protein FimT
MPTDRGYSLWELLCALTVISTLVGLGVPGFQRFVLDARQTADINGFVNAVQLARSESTKRARPVLLCKTADAQACGGNEIGYERGWMVFVNMDDRWPPARSADEPLLLRYFPSMIGTIRSNRDRFEFRPFRRRSTNGTISFCDRRGTAAARAVIISFTGRPRTADRGPGRDLICADLP